MIEEIVSYTWLPILVALAVAVVKIEKLMKIVAIVSCVAFAFICIVFVSAMGHEIFNHVFRRF